MTAAQSFKIYETLGKYFQNNEDAKIVVTEIEQIIETKIEGKKDVLAAKEDIAAVRTELANTKQELAVAIARSEAKLTVRMFYFWIGQVAVIAGMLAYFFKGH